MLDERAYGQVIDDESMPWLPFEPYSSAVQLKLLRLDPVRGECIVLIKASSGARLPRYRHSGPLTVYTLAGRWKFEEQDWVAGPGSLVFEAAASTHTPHLCSGAAPTLTLNIVAGDVAMLDEHGEAIGIENWKTCLQRYQAYCEMAGIVPRQLTPSIHTN